MFAPKQQQSSGKHPGQNNNQEKKPFVLQRQGLNAGIQAKLKVGQTNDKFEKEADSVADQVVSNSEAPKVDAASTPPIQTQKVGSGDLAQRETEQGNEVQLQEEEEVQLMEETSSESEEVQLKTEPEVQAKLEPAPVEKKAEEVPVQKKEIVPERPKPIVVSPAQLKAEVGGEEVLQMKEDEEMSGEAESLQMKSKSLDSGDDVSTQINSAKGGGSPMEDTAKMEMEQGFGHDFSNVRIHTDSNSAGMNKSLGAKAFTSGNDIFFNEGEYRPDTEDGKHLLAHELTHTLQQEDGPEQLIQRTPEGDLAAESFKALLKKKKSKNAVEAYRFLKSLEETVRVEVMEMGSMKEWIEAMEENLPVEFIESPEFGFHAGLPSDELTKDAEDSILVQQLNESTTWEDEIKLDLLLKMIVQAGIQDEAVPIVKSRWASLKPEIQPILEGNGFTEIGYTAPLLDEDNFSEGSSAKSGMNYLFGSGKKALHKGVVFNYLGKKNRLSKKATLIGFPLGDFQKASGGHIAGAHFSDEKSQATTRSELKKQGFSKKEFNVDTFVSTPSTVSFQFNAKNGSFLVNAFDLPMDSINMQFKDSTIRVGESNIKALKAKYYWPGLEESIGNGGYLEVDELSFRNIRSISKDSTIGIGLLALQKLKVSNNQPLGTSDSLLGFYEAVLACLDQVMDILYLVLDAGMTVADRYFKGVGTEALAELNEIVAKHSSDLSISLSIGGMQMKSFIDSQYALIDSISLGETNLGIGGAAFVQNYEHQIKMIEKRATTESREISSAEQAQIDSYKTLISKEKRITELNAYMNQTNVQDDANYSIHKAELDALLVGRQMAINLSTSSLEISGTSVKSDSTKLGADQVAFENFSAFAGMDQTGVKQIRADWGKSSIGVIGEHGDPTSQRGAYYDDGDFDFNGGITMDGGNYQWKEGEGDKLSLANPLLYSDKIDLNEGVDLGMGRSDVSSTILQVLDKDVPFLKAQEVILRWPSGGGLIPNIEVVNPTITDLEFESKREILMSVEDYVNEDRPTASDWSKGHDIKRLKDKYGDNVPLWSVGDKYKFSGKIEGNLTLVQNTDENKWELKLAPEEKALIQLSNVLISSRSNPPKATSEGWTLSNQHEWDGDKDKYPNYPKIESKKEKLDFGFMDGLEATTVELELFGRTTTIQVEEGGYIAPAKALNQIYRAFLSKFKKSQLSRNLDAGARRLADHLSGKTGYGVTALVLWWTWQEAYDNLSYPLKMLNGLNFRTWISGGYYQLATYNKGTLVSTYKLAPANAETLSPDKRKIRISDLIEYQLRTEKSEKKPERSKDIVDAIVTDMLDLFKRTWNAKSLEQWLVIGKNLETTPTNEVRDKIDAWWAQATPGLAIFGIGNYIATVADQQGVAEGVISGIMNQIATSNISTTASGEYSIPEGSAKGTVGFSINEKVLPEFSIPDLLIEKIDRNYGKFEVNLSNLHLKDGIVKSNNWKFSSLDMKFPNSTLESLSVEWPIEKKKK